MLLVAVLALPASAQAVDLRFPDGRTAQPYTRWAAAARVPGPPLPVVTVVAQCPDYPDDSAVWGCAGLNILYLNYERRRDRNAFFHELGHVFDFQVMSEDARSTVEKITGAPWDGERFADTYAVCAQNKLTGAALMQTRRVCSLIRRQARRHDVLRIARTAMLPM
jgi:hypothetical protein